MKLFLGVYFFSAILTFFFIIFPTFPALLFLFTFGIGFVFLLAPTVLVYMTAVAPGFFLSRDKRDFRKGIVLGAAGLILVSAGPHLWALGLAYRDAKPILDQDLSGRLAVPPRRLEIQLSSPGYNWRDDPLLAAPCDDYCQILLHNGEVDELRITPIQEADDSPRGRRGGPARFAVAGTGVVYRYEKRWSCPKAFARGETALPATRLRASRGECIVAMPGGGWLPSVRILVTEAPDWSLSEKPREAGRSLTRFEIFDVGAGSAFPVARFTEMRASLPTLPFLYAPTTSTHGLPSDFGILKRAFAVSAISLGSVLQQALGFKLQTL